MDPTTFLLLGSGGLPSHDGEGSGSTSSTRVPAISHYSLAVLIFAIVLLVAKLILLVDRAVEKRRNEENKAGTTQPVPDYEAI